MIYPAWPPDLEKLYVDSVPLIYLVEENEIYLSSIRRIAILIDTTPLTAFSSVLTMTEVLVKPLRQGKSNLIQEYRDILIKSEDYTLVPVSLEIATQASVLRARYNLRTPDSVHLATALATGCDAFLTNDADFKRIRDIPILLLDELEK